jgi:hypothetical protein
MSIEPSRLTDDERKKLTHIPDNVETRDVLENLLFNLSLMVYLQMTMFVKSFTIGNNELITIKV